MVELKLDTAAVNALFPEGTQARVNLQQAVINNITSNILDKRINQDVLRQIEETAKEYTLDQSLTARVQKELDAYLTKRGWNSPAGLTSVRKSEVQSIVNAEVKGLCYAMFEELVKECTENAKKEFGDGMTRKIRYALENAQAHFAARLNDGFKEILDKAIVQRMGLEVKS
ncbi:hypothetical protein Hena1_02190 [Erwinia phage Hena1]|uniref:Uncharacterized protein n=1 Tax=Erwinia phage Hena1 TaxID=2678601 RepID=A0A6B9JA03_9CAUD|nr:hypothetical protein HWC84_gp145 [Erwinia phage Hena1]QGZ16369.1 hypothetical protein Hena1_02190 [Erwinia phage Hena1]